MVKSQSPSLHLHFSHARRLDYILAFGLFFVLFLLYAQTAGPSLGGLYDSEEYQWTAYALDFAPSTGYPFYLLLGKLWIAIAPFGNVAHRMNLLSGLLAALAVGILYLNAYGLTGDRCAALIGAGWLGTNSFYWLQASVAAVSPLHFLLLGLIFLALFLWASGRVPLELAAGLIGLSLAHHRSTLAILPGVALFIWLHAPNVLRQPKLLLRCFVAGVIPLLLYFYIPFTASPSLDRQVIVNQIIWGNTTVNSPEQQVIYFKQVVELLEQWLAIPGLILLTIGLASSALRQRASSFGDFSVTLLLVLSATLLGLLPVFQFLEVERYALAVFLLCMFWVVGGVHSIRWALVRASISRRWRLDTQLILALLLIGWLALSLPWNRGLADESQNQKEYGLWSEIFNLPLETRAAILVNWSELNSMRYLQVVEGKRPDLESIRIDQNAHQETQEIDMALARGQPIYLTPSTPEPESNFHYSAVGPLLRIDRGPIFGSRALPLSGIAAQDPPIQLLDYQVSRSLQASTPTQQIAVAAGNGLRLGLTWQVLSQMQIDYQLRVRLLDEQGHVWSEIKGAPLRGRYGTSQWLEDQVIFDSHGISVWPGTPPGEYQISLEWIDPITGKPSPATDKAIRVNVQRAHFAPDQVFARERTSAVFGNRLSLVGFSAYSKQVQPGARFTISLNWHARADPLADYKADFRLADASGLTVGEWKEIPPVHSLKTSEWVRGDTFKEYYDLTVPANLPSEAKLYVSLRDTDGKILPISIGARWSDITDFLERLPFELNLPSGGTRLSNELFLVSLATTR